MLILHNIALPSDFKVIQPPIVGYYFPGRISPSQQLHCKRESSMAIATCHFTSQLLSTHTPHKPT